jgi:hypothetical protein
MPALDRLRRRSKDDVSGGGGDAVYTEDRSEEGALRARLTEDPNDSAAFDRLAKIVRSRAVEGHDAGDPQREADDAVWALAEEVAHNGRAWYPLIQLARLSIDDDREVALRRLATAADRDASGQGLAQGLAMLRDTGHAVDALNLGVGHWRPREHVVDAGRQLIEAAVEADRPGEARRHLNAMAAHPDKKGVERLRRELEGRIAQADRNAASRRAAGGTPAFGIGLGATMTGTDSKQDGGGSAPFSGAPGASSAAPAPGVAPAVDVREEKGSRLLGFLRR